MQKKILLSILTLLIGCFSVFILYNTFISFRYQLLLRSDVNNANFTRSITDIESIPDLPNIGITTLPIISQKAKYYFYQGRFSEGLEMLENGSKINPYIYYSEYLLASYYLNVKNYDTAIYYAKKAFYGWPKNITHYKLYNKLLEVKKDTIGILDAYDFINTVFKPGKLHQELFIDSYSNAKLRYLIFDYPNKRSISKSELIGKWRQMYEFETGQINFQNNIIVIDRNNFYVSTNKSYRYTLSNDTLKLFFKSNNKLVSSYPVFYSDSLNTLILKNVPMNVVDDNVELQDQFFKKIDD